MLQNHSRNIRLAQGVVDRDYLLLYGGSHETASKLKATDLLQYIEDNISICSIEEADTSIGVCSGSTIEMIANGANIFTADNTSIELQISDAAVIATEEIIAGEIYRNVTDGVDTFEETINPQGVSIEYNNVVKFQVLQDNIQIGEVDDIFISADTDFRLDPGNLSTSDVNDILVLSNDTTGKCEYKTLRDIHFDRMDITINKQQACSIGVYSRLQSFYFEGTTTRGVPTSATLLYDVISGTIDVRIQDVTNNQTIATLLGLTSAVEWDIAEFISLTNLPTGAAIIDVQIKSQGFSGTINTATFHLR